MEATADVVAKLPEHRTLFGTKRKRNTGAASGGLYASLLPPPVQVAPQRFYPQGSRPPQLPTQRVLAVLDVLILE
jgi:hypothetical protein